jgi:hypothetical protein
MLGKPLQLIYQGLQTRLVCTVSLSRRRNSYWEPIFDESIREPFKEGLWDFSNQRGPKRLVFRPDESQEKTLVVKSVTFDEVDFEGEFNYRIIFVNCKFKKCDFGSSTFERAKFTGCTFIQSTFSLCYMNDCELRECTFDRIGFSGNETILDKTLITNPSSFISGGKPNLDHLPNGKTAFEQRMRFEVTRSTLARSLMFTLANEGSEANYYDGVKTSTLQDCRAKSATNLLGFREAWVKPRISVQLRLWKSLTSTLGLFGALLDFAVLMVFGLINSWGSSVARPVFIGLCLILAFACYYSYAEDMSMKQGSEKAAEILLLFGYTKHSILDVSNNNQLVQFSNALVGVLWYVVTIPTIVNKLTRVRG